MYPLVRLWIIAFSLLSPSKFTRDNVELSIIIYMKKNKIYRCKRGSNKSLWHKNKWYDVIWIYLKRIKSMTNIQNSIFIQWILISEHKRQYFTFLRTSWAIRIISEKWKGRKIGIKKALESHIIKFHWSMVELDDNL